jgi:hypothetical protein
MITVFVKVEASPGNRAGFDFPVRGYYQLFGVTSRSHQEMVDQIKKYLTDDVGSSLIEVDEMWVPDFEDSDADLKDVCGDLGKVGIWYTSGRAFFHDENE